MAAWARQGRLPMFAINESASMGGCDATAAPETRLGRYVKHELNTLAWAGLIVVTFLLARRLCAVVRLLIMGHRLPGPPARALTGQSKCLSTVHGPQTLQDLLARLHQEHGPVVKIWTGPAQLLVSVRDINLLQHVLELAKDRVPAPRVALQLVYGQRSLFFSEHSKGLQSRLSLEEEVHGKFLGEAHRASVKVAESVTRWAKPARELDCIAFSRLMAFAALGTALYGDEYMASPVGREFEEVIVDVTEELPSWMPYNVPPLWNAKFNAFRTKCQRLRALARQLVAHGKQPGLGSEGDDELADDFFGSLLGFESRSEPRASGIMSHGSLNTAGVLSGVLVQLAHHPHIQAKVHDEILTVSGGRSAPTEADMRKMTLLTATVHEAARLLPTAPFLQRCSVEHDVELESGVIIPAGAILVAPVQLIHQDGGYWGEDADVFNPDRFLKELASEQVHKSNHDMQKCAAVQEHPSSGVYLESNPALLVFGAGPRSCIGSNFALKQISALVAVILQRFELKEVSDPSVETSKRRAITLFPR